MERKQISLEQLSDIYGFRIVVPDVPDCYHALAVVHTTWHAVPGRFKDYISNPKQNDYQSIHTTIVGPAPSTRRAADPHREDALDRRIRRRRACALQGHERQRHEQGALARFRRLSLAAPSRRHAARRRQPGRIPRAHQARAVPGPGVLLHAERPADRSAARRELHRLRLCGPYRCRQYLRRRQDQRPAHAARHPAAEWRRGGDHLLRSTSAAGRLAEPCRHRQGALGHQTGHPRCGARAIRQARPRDSRPRLSAPGQDLQRGESRSGARPAVSEDRRGRHGGGGARRTRLGRRAARGVPRGSLARAPEAPPQGEAHRGGLVWPRQGHGAEVPLARVERQGAA